MNSCGAPNSYVGGMDAYIIPNSTTSNTSFNLSLGKHLILSSLLGGIIPDYINNRCSFIRTEGDANDIIKISVKMKVIF